MAGRKYSKLLGKMVEVEWEDPSGYINENLRDVKLSKCTSWGLLKELKKNCIILQTSKYEDSESGDYTTINTGCITALRAYQPDS